MKNDFAKIRAATPDNGVTTTLSGGPVWQRPPTVIEIIRLADKYPSLQKVLFGLALRKGFEMSDVITAVLKECPDALPAFIAISAGEKGNDEAAADIEALPDVDFLKLLETALSLLMPGGLEDFFDRFAGIMRALGMDPEEDEPAPDGSEADSVLTLSSN